MLLSWLRRVADSGRAPLRPPGAVPESEFQKKCIRCRKCIEICPYESIRAHHAESGLGMGTPFIRPREIPCYLCMKCPPVCPSGALEPITEKTQVHMGVAEIDRSMCLAYNGVLCRACYERCPIYREAITLKEEVYPVVHPEKCVGCGICENVCPTDPPSIVVYATKKRS